jgi:hypothetical protein
MTRTMPADVVLPTGGHASYGLITARTSFRVPGSDCPAPREPIATGPASPRVASFEPASGGLAAASASERAARPAHAVFTAARARAST